MAFTQRDGAALYWKLEGLADAPPLVLLNSIGLDMDLWDALLPVLRGRFLLLRVDTRGHGASTATPGDYSLAGLAGDVAAIMADAGIDRAAVAGVSLGGMIAMELALAAPARVQALALVCTSATMDPQAWTDRIALVRAQGMAAIADLAMGRFLSPAFVAGHPEIEATIRRELVAMAALGYAGCGAAIRDMALAGRLGGIACPTLVVTGDRDTSTPLVPHGEYLLAQLPAPAHVAIDAAHLAPIEAPAALAQALTSFLLH